MNGIKRIFCCCQEPVEASPQPEPQVLVTKKEDMYLDSDDPVQAIMDSPEIQGLTLASIDFFLDGDREVDKQYSTGSEADAKEFKKAIALAKRENPDACTTLMKDLLKLLPKKKSVVRKNSKVIPEKKNSNPYLSEMSSSKTNGFPIQRKQSNKVANLTNLNSTSQSNSNEVKTIQTNGISVKPKGYSSLEQSSMEQIEPVGGKKILELLDLDSEINQTGSFLGTKNKKSALKSIGEETSLGQNSTIATKTSNLHHKNSLEPLKHPPSKFQNSNPVAEEHEQFKNKLDTLVQSQQDENLKIIKAFVYLYTSPYIYKDLNKRLTQKRYDNYTKIVAFVMESFKKLPEEKVKDFKLPFTTGFSMYRGLKSTQLGKMERGYWKAFTSCTLKKSIAEEFAARQNGGCLLEIQFKPPVQHMYIRVPNSTQFTFYDEAEVILFPFFPYEVLERNKEKSKYVLRELKQSEEEQLMSEEVKEY